ncbi:tyrosine-protein phosphatase non-receptor type 21-like isoform X1 [Branchiostoma lanceolatum]|uniref:tyrosine-protein phosphatase non-receptor type 21-like isoform X1 n=1 Tax=Branchiostoma lanceolatum TaxID=7740 RepID=UPI0034545458
MPFGLKLKKTKRYNVHTKNSFVIPVQLLDNTVIECTITTESTGRHCLEAVGQRLELQEVCYFGLRYLSKRLQLQWVELEKPLKKQLDKLAHEPLVYFAVMFYVSNVQKLNQEITRYLFYLQLKSDVIEGRLPCTPEQAMLLASYAIQAEFGDHDSDKHTVDFFKDFILFPPAQSQDDTAIADHVREVINAHQRHRGMAPAQAELSYILEAQQLDGYGQEAYPAKDEAGNNLEVGASYVGIFVKHLSGLPTVYFKWHDVSNIVHNKRLFGVESAKTGEIVQFVMEDAEMTKYVWRMCVLKHKFYRINRASVSKTVWNEVSLDGHRSNLKLAPLVSAASPLKRTPTITKRDAAGMSPVHEEDEQNAEEEAEPSPGDVSYNSSPQVSIDYGLSGSMDNVLSSSTEYVLSNSTDYLLSNSTTSMDRLRAHTPGVHSYMNGSVPMNGSVYNSANSLNHSQVNIHRASPASSNPSINSNTDVSRVDLRPQLPAYRPTPDYETAVRNNRLRSVMDSGQSQSLINLGLSGVYNNPETMVYSQPDMIKHDLYSQRIVSLSQERTFVQSPAVYSPSHTNTTTETFPLHSASFSHTVSTPELAKPYTNMAQITVSSEALLHHYKPPPPYPRHHTSTPDLAMQRYKHPQVSSSSPDLLPRRIVPVPRPQIFQEESIPLVHALQEASRTLVRSTSSLKDEHIMHPAVSIGSVRELPIPEDGPIPPPPYPQNSLPSGNGTLLQRADAMLDVSQNSIRAAPVEQQSANVARPPVQDSPITNGPSAVAESPQDDVTPSPPDSTSPHRPVIHEVSVIIHEPSPPVHVVNCHPSSPDQSSSSPEVEEAPIPPPRHRKRPVSLVDIGVGTDQELSNESLVHVGRGSEECVTSGYSTSNDSDQEEVKRIEKSSSGSKEDNMRKIGPLKLAAMNGLTIATLPRASKRGSGRTPRDERIQRLEECAEDGVVFTEFSKVYKKKEPAIFMTAQKPDNQARNRFKDILPYEESRVRLMPTQSNPAGYINASHIKMPVGESELKYIAAQGPMENTTEDFWRMVWNQEVLIIAMLSHTKEGEKEKSYQYWPTEPTQTCKFGEVEVTLRFSSVSGPYATRGMSVKHMPSGETRTLWHLQFLAWPEHGCPQNVQDFLCFLEEVQSVKRLAYDMPVEREPPLLVHCGNGVGRTGVHILSEVMIRTLEHNKDLDLPTALTSLRDQRMMTVPMLAQYKFVYSVLIQYLKNSRLI